MCDDAERFFCTGICTNSCTAGSSRLTIEPKLSLRNINASSKPRKAKAEKVPAEPKRAAERRRKTRIINDRTPRRSPTAKPCRACAADTTRSEDTPFFFGSCNHLISSTALAVCWKVMVLPGKGACSRPLWSRASFQVIVT